MDKPKNYSYYSNRKKNGIPYKDWPQECKDYNTYRRDLRRHPEWKSLSDEEIKKRKDENKKERGRNGVKAIIAKYYGLSESERKEWNKKKKLL